MAAGQCPFPHQPGNKEGLVRNRRFSKDKWGHLRALGTHGSGFREPLGLLPPLRLVCSPAPHHPHSTSLQGLSPACYQPACVCCMAPAWLSLPQPPANWHLLLLQNPRETIQLTVASAQFSPGGQGHCPGRGSKAGHNCPV